MKGSEFTIDLDTLILAIGQKPDTSYIPANTPIKITKWDTLEVDQQTFQTADEMIFAGGDVVSGPANVVDALAHGKIAAKMIGLFVNNKKPERKYHVTRPALIVDTVKLSEEELETLKRPEMPALSLQERLKGFDEVELGFTGEQAMMEAKRCLRCELEVHRLTTQSDFNLVEEWKDKEV